MFFRSMGSFLFKSKAPDCHEGEVKFHTAAGAQRGTKLKMGRGWWGRLIWAGQDLTCLNCYGKRARVYWEAKEKDMGEGGNTGTAEE